MIVVDEVPIWPCWPSPHLVSTISLDNHIYVILTDNIDKASDLVSEHYSAYKYIGSQELMNTISDLDVNVLSQQNAPCTYIITSISHVQIFKRTNASALYTPIKFLSNDKNPLWKVAMRRMLNAIHGHAYPLRTPMQNLPTELVDMLLDRTTDTPSRGSINCALHAAILGIGPSFSWQSRGLPLRPQNMTGEPALYDHFVEASEFKGMSRPNSW
jgi:hypothetical protein